MIFLTILMSRYNTLFVRVTLNFKGPHEVISKASNRNFYKTLNSCLMLKNVYNYYFTYNIN